MKTCVRCGEDKPLDEFHWKIVAKGIRQSCCKDCAKTKAALWRAKHPERVDANNRRYWAENRDALIAIKRAKYIEDPDWRRESDRRYYFANREKRHALTMEWRRKNPAAKLAHDHKRRSAYRSGPDDLAYIAVLRRDPCSYCGDAAGTIDHIQPLDGGGSGSWGNLTASCRRCNARKRTTDVLGFLLRNH